MRESTHRAVAIVGVGAIMPDAPNTSAFWKNIKDGRYSISDVQPDRWETALYFDPDPKAPDKTYSKIGGWVRDFEWDPLKWKLPIPPRVSTSMDLAQKWAIIATREALNDFGFPQRAFDTERTAVIIGNALGGDTHLLTSTRILFPEHAAALTSAPSFAELPAHVRENIFKDWRERIAARFPEITEDTMPGELSNIVAGRIAALYNFHGPNFSTDAACASAMAAITAAIDGLAEHDFDTVITGGIDANMSPSTYVKFCKIGALSATGTRPYAEGADGFVMGEGAAVFILKRLADAERDGDKIYAVIRGLAGTSDGKGKGITAPNPIGQRLAVERAWQKAGLSSATATMIEGHGTSTVVGDVAEVQSLIDAFGHNGIPVGSIALGSVKSNIGHLKGAAGAAGLLKAALALHEKVLPPSLNFAKPNPNIDFAHSPFYVNTELRPWEATRDGVRRAGVSAFGFGGTNFHAVLEEYIPGRIKHEEKTTVFVSETKMPMKSAPKLSMRGALVIGAVSETELIERLTVINQNAAQGNAPAIALPRESDLRAPKRIAIDYGNAAELAKKSEKALKALRENKTGAWKALRAQGIFLGSGKPGKVAFLSTGQGSQYANMLRELKEKQPIVAETFAEADRVMTPLLDKPLTSYIFVDESNPEAMARAEEDLRQTAITQPAVLTVDVALTRLLAAYGVMPDMVMGHSLGEYGALVASGAMPFGDALKAVSARGMGMTKVAVDDNGMMAAVFGPLSDVEKILEKIEGYVVIANINCENQVVIGGATAAMQKAMAALKEAGFVVRLLPVSHAFHTKIVAAASEPLRGFLRELSVQSPSLPIVANVTGEFYPMGQGVVPQMIELIAQQVAAPVQFVKGLNTLYEAGARIFVEVGPKKVLHGFVEDVLIKRGDISAVFTNFTSAGDITSFNQALCGLYAAGVGVSEEEVTSEQLSVTSEQLAVASDQLSVSSGQLAVVSEQKESAAAQVIQESRPMARESNLPSQPASSAQLNGDRYLELGHLFAEFLERGIQIYSNGKSTAPQLERVCISGAAMGLPGTERVYDDANLERILRGEVFIDVIPNNLRKDMIDKNITRLVKSDEGAPRFETLDNLSEAIKLAGRKKQFDLVGEFGFPQDRMPALDVVTALAIAAGLDALRDAGIPLVMNYKTTSKGTKLPDRWMLPDELRDETGVIFTSAFPGYDSYAQEMTNFHKYHSRLERLQDLESLRADMPQSSNGTLLEIDRRIQNLRAELEKEHYTFDRRFLLRVLAMGHSQFAEYIGARGPNSQINAACASTTQAVGLANDWIQCRRCRRVIIISADDITTDNLMGWFGAGFLASGVAATDEIVEEAALPFDRRRHGMIVGMGGAALVVETYDAALERGIQPICEVLNTIFANSAFHGTRLDINHISEVMEKLVSQAEARWMIDRHQIASQMVFVSHETYTPARGGSASAEINALRSVFGAAADSIVIANTKGYTGHAMATGIEDVLGVKAIETSIVPPVPNFKEIDPELGALNISKGGIYPVQYALRLGAGFGSQISMSLLRWIPTPDGRHRAPRELGFSYRIVDQNAWRNWLRRVTGYENPEIEVDHRTLRVKDQGPAKKIERPVAIPREVAKPISTPVVEKVVAAPAPKLSVPPPAAPAPAVDPVKEKVLKIIAEKTGYPIEMLDLELDLEADLGIDTVKQAEMFAAIREAYNIPRDENLKLRDFPTLAHTIKFVYDRRPDLKQEASEQVAIAQSAPTLTSVDDTDPVQQKVLQIIAEKTGYPIEMLDLELDLEADLGIDTVKQAEMFAAIRQEYGIPREDTLKLRDFPTLAHTIKFVYDRRPDLKQVASEQVEKITFESATSAAPIDDPVKAKALQLIAEKTGYPIEMLDLDLDLEADLGIDTVKQAEMFAAIRQEYGIPREDTLKLRDFPTLAHTIKFVYDRRPDLKQRASGQVASMQVASAQPATATADDPVKEKVLQLIAEKTGYPVEMLDLDLDLEADLGIDTVKQAEMFAAIRQEYGIPRDENLKLRDFNTLKLVIKFVYDRRPDLQQQGAAEQGVMKISTATTPTVSSAPQISLEEANKIPRRVPVPYLRPKIELCKPTGVTLNAESRVIVMNDRGGIGESLIKRLSNLGAEVLIIDDAPDAEKLAARIQDWLANGPIQGIFWLSALDHEGNLNELNLETWREAARVRVKLLYATMRALYEQINKPGTFLIAATRLGGLHGYDEAGALAPLGGAVTGFCKAYKRERSEALVKVVDFESSRKTAALADLLVDEMLFDPGVVEIGYRDEKRWTIGFEEKSAVDGKPGITLNKETVFLITGAAGSIVSAITADLAAASGGTFYLLDLASKPDPNNSDLRRFATDKENLKRDIFERLKAEGKRATPAMVEKEMAGLERVYAAQTAIEAVKKAGGVAHYYSVNMLDAEAVGKVVAEVKQQTGRIDVLLHAAGLEISRLLPDKKPQEFDLVFDVKCEGWFNLMNALGDMPIGAVVAFSSIAGRFGNGGQTDYSSANDFLCKSISNFRTTRPNTRGIAIDWTAWGGIGMAARGSIPTIMKQAGIDMLTPEAGIPIIRRELTSGGTRGELIIAQRLGIMLNEFDSTGGLDTSKLNFIDNGVQKKGVMVEKVMGMGLYNGLMIETILDPTKQPFLYDHKIGGTAVLPGVMGLEALVEIAKLIFPDLHVAAIEHVNFLAPFKFYRDQARTVTTHALFRQDGNEVVADCRLIGSRILHGQSEPEVTTHFTARVRLAENLPKAIKESSPALHDGAKINAGDIYQLYFHGPAYQVLQQGWKNGGEIVGRLAESLPANHEPEESMTLIAPRLIELCFQTAGLWEMGKKSRMGLPYQIDRVTLLRNLNVAQDGMLAIVAPTVDGAFDARVVDAKGNVYLKLQGYRTIELPETINAELLKPLQEALK